MSNSLVPIFCATVLYPNKEGSTFDFQLWADKLMPEYAEILGDNCVKYEIRKVVATPNAPTPNFICSANFWIKSPEKFGASMADPRMRELMKQISSFTDIQPIRQFEQVVI
jgi:uncharacterized protein (TIGR02118 family)